MNPAELYFAQENGPQENEGTLPPLVILHGLFGSSRNWTSIARLLADERDVYCLDARNHGDSPHADTHTLTDLREDLHGWIQSRSFAQPPIVIGHSMGGMAAMACALAYPESMQALVVVDIAPREYPPHHQSEFEALELDVAGCATRGEVDARMQTIVADPMVRQFLQMNLIRRTGGENGYAWRINVPALKAAAGDRGLEAAELSGAAYAKPTLFIRGGASDYVRDPDDFAGIHERFSAARIETIAGQGHWLHYSATQEFLQILQGFLQEIKAG